MNVLKPMPEIPEADDRIVPIGRDMALPPAIAPGAGRKTFRMFLVAALLVGGGVAFGMWRHSLAEAEVNATSEQRRSDQVILNPPSDIGEGRMVNAQPVAAPNG
jgi:hypothetical protein